MRVALPSLVMVIGGGVLAGCSLSAGGSECIVDRDCEGDVCARDGLCHPASEVRAVTVRWTVRGAAASADSCAGNPDLFLRFDGPDSNDRLGFSPVPCSIGQFSMDKLPSRYEKVELGIEGGGFKKIGVINRDNAITFDVVPRF